MSHVGIVIISHSEQVAEGVKAIIRQVVEEVPVETAGGTDDGEIGTSLDKILNAIDRADANKGVLLFYDLGSAKMNAEIAIEMCNKENVLLVEAPLLEGAYIGAVEAGLGKEIDEIVTSIKNSFRNN
mgnify:CR=1 FL=1